MSGQTLITHIERPNPRIRMRSILLVSASALTLGCAVAPDRTPTPASDDASGRLPTGVRLDPAAELQPVGQMPLAMVVAPGGEQLVLLLNGLCVNGIYYLGRACGRVMPMVPLPLAFLASP